MKRVLLFGALALLVIRLVLMVVIPARSGFSTDFQNYYTASWAVHHGDSLVDLYDPLWFENERELSGIRGGPGLFGAQTPFSALLMLPVASLSPMTAKRIWILFNVSALLLLIAIAVRASSLAISVVLLIALLGGDALGNIITDGSFYVVLTLLIVLAVVFRDKVPWLAGMSVGLATVVNVFPGFLVLCFAVTRRWRACAWSVLGIVLFSMLSVAMLGWAPHRVFVEEVLPRLFRGEIGDPYTAPLRRALMFEPGLNPHPLVEAPTLYFFLSAALALSVMFITLMTLRQNSQGDRRSSPLLELGAIVTAILLLTPESSVNSQFLLFPVIAAAVVHFKRFRVQATLAGVFVLLCSKVMDAGFVPLVFPRFILVSGLWIVFLVILDAPSLPRRTMAVGLGIVMVLAGVSAAAELARWSDDQHDGATMVSPDRNSLSETFPTIGIKGLVFSSLKPDGYSMLHPSALGNGMVYELPGTVYGKTADGRSFGWSGATEPSLGVNSVMAIRHDNQGWALVERSPNDVGWRELYRSSDVLHDPASSADGNRVAFSEWAGGRYRIMEWNRGTQAVRPLVSGSDDYRYPAYSASGRWLFFSENISGQWDVVRLSLEDGLREVLTSSESNDFMPAISSDEHTLYFASDRRRGYRFTAIYKLNLR